MTEKIQVKIVLPVYNEEKELKANVLKIRDFIRNNLPGKHIFIEIVDNASTDSTAKVGKEIAGQYEDISFLHLDQKGRGRAIKRAWGKDDADIFIYMDIDLSTDLIHLPDFINSLDNGYDIAIGSRLLPESKVVGRTLKREILSRFYNLLIKLMFQTRFSDAQCGFKGVNRRIVRELLPKIRDNEWFFDSELLITGEKTGYRIFEKPVFWTDNPGSTVRVMKTVTGDLKGLWRLFISRPWRK